MEQELTTLDSKSGQFAPNCHQSWPQLTKEGHRINPKVTKDDTTRSHDVDRIDPLNLIRSQITNKYH